MLDPGSPLKIRVLPPILALDSSGVKSAIPAYSDSKLRSQEGREGRNLKRKPQDVLIPLFGITRYCDQHRGGGYTKCETFEFSELPGAALCAVTPLPALPRIAAATQS